MFAATLLVDASWCPQTGIVGVGYWVASDRGKVGGSSVLDDICSNSTQAEMLAVCEVVRKAKKASLLRFGDRILIQTDCAGAIQAFEGLRGLTPIENQIVDRLYKLTKGMHFEFRHVKSDTFKTNARYVAQNRCDIQAKAAMRYRRDQVKRQSCEQI